MVKGKKHKLIAARKEVMSKIMADIQPSELDSDDDSLQDNLQDNLQDEKEAYMQLEMFQKIREDMFSFINDEFLPLCEYLTIDDIEEFINKVAT